MMMMISLMMMIDDDQSGAADDDDQLVYLGVEDRRLGVRRSLTTKPDLPNSLVCGAIPISCDLRILILAEIIDGDGP